MSNLSFAPLTLNDLSLLHQWFQEPVIHKLYGRSQNWSMAEIERKYKPRILGKEHIPSFIIHLDSLINPDDLLIHPEENNK